MGEPDKTAGNRDSSGKFTPGNNANPKGRPRKELSLVSMLKAELEALNKEGLTNAQAIAKAMVAAASRQTASPAVWKELLDRIDGKVKQDIGLGADEGMTLTLEVVKSDEPADK